jgi:hypothetical protein
MQRRSGLVILCSLVFLALTVLGARPAAAQYGPPPGPPPPPPGGGYYQPQPRPYYQPPPPPPGVQRRGFTIGASIGPGSFSITDKDANVDDQVEGASGEIHLGGMITPRLAILFDGWAVGGDVNDYQSVFHNIGTVSLRAFLGQWVWLQGGLGFAYFTIDDRLNNTTSESSESGGAGMIAVGVEFFQDQHLTLDVSLRLGAASYSNADVSMGALQLGINWY